MNKNNYHNVKSYEGVLNPYNEYVFNSRDEGLVKALADRGYSALSNINDEYTDPETGRIAEGTPYYDDAHSYRVTFHNDSEGNPVISASDLYDFGENYSEGFGDLYEERTGAKNGKKRLEIQRRLLNSVGQPYKLVQKDIPIRFTDNPQGSEIYRTNSITNQVLDRLTDEQIAALLGSGYINPSQVESSK